MRSEVVATSPSSVKSRVLVYCSFERMVVAGSRISRLPSRYERDVLILHSPAVLQKVERNQGFTPRPSTWSVNMLVLNTSFALTKIVMKLALFNSQSHSFTSPNDSEQLYLPSTFITIHYHFIPSTKTLWDGWLDLNHRHVCYIPFLRYLLPS